MSFLGHLNKEFKLQRRSAEVLTEQTISASMSLTRSAGETSCFLVTISGADTTGTVNLIGDVAGVSTTETLTFNAAESIQSANEFDDGALTAVEPSGLTGSIQIDACTPYGSPLVQNLDLISSFPARLWDRRQDTDVVVTGQDERESHTVLMYPQTSVIQGGDLFVDLSDTTKTYRALGVANRYQTQREHHWAIPVVSE